jgi:hypothetical protein
LIKTLRAANHIVAMQTGPLKDLGAKPQVNFPVKVISVFSFDPTRDFTIAQTDKAAMEQTFRFVRYISANPTSTLATQFLDAVGQKDQNTAVNDFFANSQSFKLCTLSTWTSIMSWSAAFLSAWQGNYYLYDTASQSKPGTLVAGVAITLNGTTLSAKMSMADAEGKWSDSSQVVDLKIADGVISESNPGETGASANLQPVWMNTVEAKGTTVNNVIAPAMAGTVSGKKVVGNFKKITPTPKSTTDKPSTAEDILSKLDKYAGLLISAGMLFVMVRQWQDAKRSKAKEVAEKEADTGHDPEDIHSDVVAAEADVKEPSELANAPRPKPGEVTQSGQALRDAEVRGDVSDAVARQTEGLRTVLENAPASSAVDKAAEALADAKAAVDSGKTDASLKKLGEVRTNVDHLLQSSGEQMSEEAKGAADKVTSDIAEQEERAAAEDQAKQDRAGQEGRSADEQFPDEDFDQPDPEPMGFGE